MATMRSTPSHRCSPTCRGAAPAAVMPTSSSQATSAAAIPPRQDLGAGDTSGRAPRFMRREYIGPGPEMETPGMAGRFLDCGSCHSGGGGLRFLAVLLDLVEIHVAVDLRAVLVDHADVRQVLLAGRDPAQARADRQIGRAPCRE